jgi:hypothetical protein
MWFFFSLLIKSIDRTTLFGLDNYNVYFLPFFSFFFLVVGAEKGKKNKTKHKFIFNLIKVFFSKVYILGIKISQKEGTKNRTFRTKQNKKGLVWVPFSFSFFFFFHFYTMESLHIGSPPFVKKKKPVERA